MLHGKTHITNIDYALGKTVLKPGVKQNTY